MAARSLPCLTFAAVVLDSIVAAAANKVCAAPLVGPFHSAAECIGLTTCQSCSVTCASGTFGNPSLLRCVAEDDPLRNSSTFDMNSTCNSFPGDAEVSLLHATRCGLNECCPPSPHRSCAHDKADSIYGSADQCGMFFDSGYTCQADFCQSCGVLAGLCDRSCIFGACDYHGDCWRGSRDGVHGAERCDDGNNISGDGCNSTGGVESGFSCQQGAAGFPDVCITCVDEPGWYDKQGYTCQDYASLGACDASSAATDPVLPGGSYAVTPSYHKYQFMYDLLVTSQEPLLVNIAVKAAHNIHLFVGRPGHRGFEAVIGGWHNSMSVLRAYNGASGPQELSRSYGTWANASVSRNFWIYYTHSGRIWVGTGAVTSSILSDNVALGSLTQTAFLGGIQSEAAQAGWGSGPMDQLHIATGWGANGSWDVRLVSGTEALTLADLGNGSANNMDASSACCACGGGHRGRKCEIEDSGLLGTYPLMPARTAAPAATGGRRLTAAPSQIQLYLFGEVSADGFKVQIAFTCPHVPCSINVVVVPQAAAANTVANAASSQPADIHFMWPALRSSSCRLRMVSTGSAAAVDHRWTATACNMTAGGQYAIVANYATASASAGTSSQQLNHLSIAVPVKPTLRPQSISFSDGNPQAMVVTGAVGLVGATDETGILQYRIYWGSSNTSKVSNIDERATIAGQVSTYSGGGFRSDLDNGCLLNDCAWKMEPVFTHKLQIHYRLRHLHTAECFCQSNPGKVLQAQACPGAVLQSTAYLQTSQQLQSALDNGGWCLWKHLPVIINGSVEVRARNAHYNECLCQIPADRPVGADGVKQPRPAGEAAVQLMIGAWCDTSWFAYKINNQHVATRRYCEWTLRPLDPTQDNNIFLKVDARTSTSATSPAGMAIVGKPSVASVQGVSAWRFSQNSALAPLPPALNANMAYLMAGNVFGSNPLVIGKDHTFAAWVKFRRVTDPAIGPGKRAIFAARSALGIREACLMVEQRHRYDYRSPECPLPLCDNGNQSHCCWKGGNSTTTSTTTTSTTSPQAACTVPSTAGYDFSSAEGSTTISGFNVSGVVCANGYNGAIAYTVCSSAGNPYSVSGCQATNATNNNQPQSLPQPLPPDPIDVCRACHCPRTDEYNDTITSLGDRFAIGLRACSSEHLWDSGFHVNVPVQQDTSWMLLVAAGTGDANGKGETVFYASTPLQPHSLSYTGTFACGAPGCTAKGTIWDVPRDTTRACYLNVGVYMTDFTNSPAHPQPQVVTSIYLRGGYPRVTRKIRTNCHPDGANQINTLFYCVHNYSVDNFVSGSNASRKLEVELTISPHVIQYPRYGNRLDGIAQVICRRVIPIDKHAPPSGTLRRVGVAGRTCAGSTLEALGGIPGDPEGGIEVDVSQAWAFNRKFSTDDMNALFFATRTRYYQDYEIELGTGTAVTANFYKARATANLLCIKDCFAEKELTGLPTTHAATCLLTVDVMITDFSNNDEYVEYVQLDGTTVVFVCQIGLDGDPTAGNLNPRYKCADKLDVSQLVLRNTYLSDGKVMVKIKISPQVNDHSLFTHGLNANVELECSGPGFGTAGSANNQGAQTNVVTGAAVHFQPATTDFLATSANLEGESGFLSGPLYDRVNGFKREPYLWGQASAVAAQVRFESLDQTGSVYLYAIEKRKANEVTNVHITNGNMSSYDICPSSTRRRGWSTISQYLLDDSIMNGCSFEPNVPYVIVVYVDRLQLPHTGGTIGLVDVVGQMPTGTPATYLTPKLKPRRLLFTDTDQRVKYLAGTITITSAYSETDTVTGIITSYTVYWGDSTGHLVPPRLIGSVPATGATTYYFTLNHEIVPLATHVLVFAANHHGSSYVYHSFVISDISMQFVQGVGYLGMAVPFANQPGVTAMNRYTAFVTLSRPDVVFDIALVRAGREVYATPAADHKGLDFTKFIHNGVDDVICHRKQFQSNSAYFALDFGPCIVVPGVEYAVVMFAGIRIECPCMLPCTCTGAMMTTVQAAKNPPSTYASDLHHARGYFEIPDKTPPTATFQCHANANCTRDESITVSIDVSDPGQSFPVFGLCVACIPAVPNPATNPILSIIHKPLAPSICVRPKDERKHRYWRLRFPQSSSISCGIFVRLAEVEFYRLSLLESHGEYLNGTAIQFNRSSNAPPVETLFDGDTSTGTYTFWTSTTLGDNWVGIDLGSGNKEAVIRARIYWFDNDCNTNTFHVHIDYSDDGRTWTERIRNTVTPVIFGLSKFSDVSNHDQSATQYLLAGTNYQSVMTGSGWATATIFGLTPNTSYQTKCRLTDSAGNGVTLSAIQAVTTDTTGPQMIVEGFRHVTDFNATLRIKLRDPGKSYPALTRCVAREYNTALKLPSLASVSGKDNVCKKYFARASPNPVGRINYSLAMKSWLTDETSPFIVEQRAWGGPKVELRTCGLRQQPMLGAGGCGSLVNPRKQALQLSVVVNGHTDAYLFIGTNRRGEVGYEFIFGGWSNQKSAIRRGYSADPKNVNLHFASIVASYSARVFWGYDKYAHFWLLVDPNSGRVEVGRGEIFGYDTIMSYVDANPIQDIDHIWAGAGYHSGGGNGVGGINFILCPRIGNWLLHQQSVKSASVSFGGTADKVVDGRVGNPVGHFCTYCSQADPNLVCAQTRKGNQFAPPWIKIDFGKIAQIKWVRVVGGRQDEILPAQSLVSCYIGNKGDNGDTPCFEKRDVTGDNYIECDSNRYGLAGGRHLSLFGDATALAGMPQNIGIRICEVEAYEYRASYPWNDIEYEAWRRYNDRSTGVPTPLTPGVQAQDFVFRGLRPNTSYEVFCYGEDSGGHYSLSGAAYAKTTDNIAPLVNIVGIKAFDHNIEVNVSLDDPGNSYPALARCAATVNGLTPQEHERYFMHQFWRIKFARPNRPLDRECLQIYVRAAAVLDINGARIPGFEYSSTGPQARGTAPTTYNFVSWVNKDDKKFVGDLAWALDYNDAWIGWDTNYVPELEQTILAKGGSVHGDLVITLEWNDTTDFFLKADLPNGATWDRVNYATPHGYMDIRCEDWNVCGDERPGQRQHLESGTFAVAEPGDYKVYVQRSYLGYSDTFDQTYVPYQPTTAYVKVCGQAYAIPLNVNISWDINNTAVVVGQFNVPTAGCSRVSRAGNLASWQSTTKPGPPHPLHTPSWYPPPRGHVPADAWDMNFTTCAQTQPGVKPWWRTDLGQTLRVEALWLAGEPGIIYTTELGVPVPVTDPAPVGSHTVKTVTSVDVWVVFANATQATQGTLCASNVKIGRYKDRMNPIRAVTCARDTKGYYPIGDHVWVVGRDLNGNQNTEALNLCEVEVITKPLAVAAQASVQWGRPPNNTDILVCGGSQVTVQWSDDNKTWTSVFSYATNPSNDGVNDVTGLTAAVPQSGAWPWWNRLFALDFTAMFAMKGVEIVNIPSLRSNSTYDVFCWAIDNNGNDISQALVQLVKPWGRLTDTVSTAVGFQGGRRLLALPSSSSGRLECSAAVKEILPCEERVITTDQIPPSIYSAALSRAERTNIGALIGKGYMAFWEMSMNDPSCVARVSLNAVVCRVRCEVFEPSKAPTDLQLWADSSTSVCDYPSCREETWSNEASIMLRFDYMVGGADYKVLCVAYDPWQNARRESYDLTMPIITTTTTTIWMPPPPPPPPPSSLTPAPPSPPQTTRYSPPPPPLNPGVTMGPAPTPAPIPRWTGYWTPAPPSFVNTPAPPTPTPRPQPRPGDATPSPPTPSPPAVSNPQVAVVAQPVNTIVTLATSSQTQAETLLQPTAMAAFLTAIRSSLQLTSDDTVEIHAARTVSLSGGRRLAMNWEVRLTLLVRMATHAQTLAVKDRIQQLGTGAATGSSAKAVFMQAFQQGLVSRGLVVSVAVKGATVADAQQVALEIGAAGSSNGVVVAGTTPQSTAAPAQKKKESSSVLVWIIVGVGVLICLFGFTALGVVCAKWIFQKSVENVADNAVARVHAREEAKRRATDKEQPKRHPRSSSADATLRKSSTRISVRSGDTRLSSNAPKAIGDIMPNSSAWGNDVMAAKKIAWAAITNEDRAHPNDRAWTPLSETSTTASLNSGSTGAAARQSVTSGRSGRPSAVIAAAPHRHLPLEDAPTSQSSTARRSQSLGAASVATHSQLREAGVAGGTLRIPTVRHDDEVEVESVSSAPQASSAASSLRLAALRQAQQPPIPPSPARQGDSRGSPRESPGRTPVSADHGAHAQSRTNPSSPAMRSTTGAVGDGSRSPHQSRELLS